MVIYEARGKEALPTAEHLANKLKSQAKIEYSLARSANKQDTFERKWGPMKRIHIDPG